MDVNRSVTFFLFQQLPFIKILISFCNKGPHRAIFVKRSVTTRRTQPTLMVFFDLLGNDCPRYNEKIRTIPIALQ